MDVWYVAKAGEDLADIARDHDSTPEFIWSHENNAGHRERRGSPAILLPGDMLYLAPYPGSMPVAAPVEVAEPPSTSTDEAWPYTEALTVQRTAPPSWECPGGICVCAGHEGQESVHQHTIFLHDELSRRMPHARCRVVLRGAVVEAPANADGAGAITFDVGERARSVLVEWAPADVPADPRLPHRRTYRLAISEDAEVGVRERLDHVGVSRKGTLRDRIEAFQLAYGLPVDGEVASIAGPLAIFHDAATLPPLATDHDARPAPLPPDVRPPYQGCVSAVERVANCHLSFRLLRTADESCALAPYVLEVEDGRVVRGTTDGDGRLEHGDVVAGDYALVVDGVRLYVPALPRTERERPILVRDDH